MDQGSFDRLTRLLSGGTTRRTGIRALLGAMIGAPVAAAAVPGAEDEVAARGGRKRDDGNRNRRKPGRGPQMEGPCGDGSRKDNVCTKDKECCTGFCDTSKGKKNKDGKGRCRCIKKGKPCKASQTCCGNRTCSDGVCGGGAAVPTGAPCASGDTCAVEGAVCTAYTDVDAPGGTFCTMPLGIVCTGDPECTCYHCGPVEPEPGMERAAGRADLACCHRQGQTCEKPRHCCTGWLCEEGSCCSAEGTACAADTECCSGLICMDGVCAPCVEAVCASGCAFDNVNAAYAAAQPGDTIYIGSGTWATGIKITKDITLAACPSVTDAKLVPDRVQKDSGDTYYVILTEDANDTEPHAVTVRNLTLEATADGITNDDEALLHSYVNGRISWTVEKSTLSKAYYGLVAYDRDHVVTDSTFTELYKGIWVEALYPSTTPVSLDVIRTTISNCDSYAINFDVDNATPESTALYTLNVTDSTIQNNGSYQVYVQSIYEEPQRSNTKATFTNTTVANGSDVGIYMYGGIAEFTGCTVSGNAYTGVEFYNASGTITDTSITGNTSRYKAGGLSVQAEYENSTVTIAGTTSITGNTGTNNAAGGVLTSATLPFVATVTGTTTSNVTGNTPNNCYKFIQSTFDGAVSCSNWTSPA